MTKKPSEKLLIGAHTSAAGGAHNALLEGAEIGATTIQFFTSNQRQWQGRTIDTEALGAWKETLAATHLNTLMSHASYLINLGSPELGNLEKSRKAFKEEIKRCILLGLSFLNFHPGAALGSGEESCLNQIVSSLLCMQELLEEAKIKLLLETTAGQGSSVGHRFEQIGYIVDRVHKQIPIGVCLDTCHVFAAGYDIRDKKSWEKTLMQFDREIGLKYLLALHVNDSVKPLGSKRDRHAPLGQGEIGWEGFKAMMHHPLLRELPKYLETPGGPPLWKQEILTLRKYTE